MGTGLFPTVNGTKGQSSTTLPLETCTQTKVSGLSFTESIISTEIKARPPVLSLIHKIPLLLVPSPQLPSPLPLLPPLLRTLLLSRRTGGRHIPLPVSQEGKEQRYCWDLVRRGFGGTGGQEVGLWRERQGSGPSTRSLRRSLSHPVRDRRGSPGPPSPMVYGFLFFSVF